MSSTATPKRWLAAALALLVVSAGARGQDAEDKALRAAEPTLVRQRSIDHLLDLAVGERLQGEQQAA